MRVCPVCDAENPPARARCTCGALLTGVDFSRPRASTHSLLPRVVQEPAEPAMPGAAPPAASAPQQTCGHDDCRQPNPPGETTCVYCGRPLGGAVAAPTLDARPLPPALRGDYRIVDAFPATGSEADILLVEQRSSGERRVVKLYRRGLEPDFALLDVLASTIGPTVVRLLAHGVSEGTAYEVLEYVPGGTLQHYLAAGPVPPSDVRAIVRDVGAALTGIHAHRILHRDVKPDNILLRGTSPLSLALTDFGIASLAAATQHFTGGARTTRYAAPEVLTGVLDAKADWWSLGMIVLEAATGRHPFDGLTEQVMNHHLATRPIDVSGVFDDDLRRLARGLLLRDPKRRFGEDEVRRWLDGDPSLAAVDDVVEIGTDAKPYRLEESEARTPAELAVALARHWDAGKRDLVRGQVVRWVETELHEHNLARRLRDIVEPRGPGDDRKLAQALIALDATLPPIWRGEPLTESGLVAHARAAAGGDEDAATWLGILYEDDVLALFAHDPALASLRTTWRAAHARFDDGWAAAQRAELEWRRSPAGRPHGPALVDDALYGLASRLPPPPPYPLAAAVLLATCDLAYASALSDEVRAGAAALGARVGWFHWRDNDDPVAALVAHHLLPLAREEATTRAAREAAHESALDDGVREARERVRARLAILLGMLPNDDAVADHATDEIVGALDPLLEQCRHALALDLSAPRHEALRDTLDRVLVRGHAVRSALAQLELVEGITALFHDPQRIGLVVMIAFIGLLSRNPYVIAAVTVGLGGFFLYRWYRRYAAQEAVIRTLRAMRLPARMFMRLDGVDEPAADANERGRAKRERTR
ncbi:MAG: protein kinase [Proteobacteria bacterium]|nr:protein kinase [Pseudomonadota bacterium]